MWFKQIQLFEIGSTLRLTPEELIPKLEQLAFIPCMPSMHQSMGWISPADVEGEFIVSSLNGYRMICMQVEEKILPATVIRQEVNEAIKQLETSQNRKLRQNEKLALKDDITMTLLPRAFSKFSKVYAYIDTKNKLVVLNTTNAKKTEMFLSLFKKSVSDEIYSLDVKKLSSIMTPWLQNQNYPSSFSIEKTAVLQDLNQENRIIRARHQDLFVPGIQSLIKDGCAVVQLVLTWQDRVTFTLANDCTLSGVQFHDEVIAAAKDLDAETKQQQVAADFLIMTETLTQLLAELLELVKVPAKSEAVA
jgi:recombination associated protein RdgC